MSKLKYPNMRSELIMTLRGLADVEYQKSVWVRHEIPPGHEETFEDSFDECVHFLFDDTELSMDPEALIGIMLLNVEEARHVRAVTQAIEMVLRKYGKNLKDEQYIAVSEWQNVVQAAANALQYIKE